MSLHVLSIINLTRVSIREQIAFACLHVSFLLFSCHFLPVWNDSTSFSRAVVVPNDRCFAPSIFSSFSVRCLCIERDQKTLTRAQYAQVCVGVNFLLMCRSLSRPSLSRPFNMHCPPRAQLLAVAYLGVIRMNGFFFKKRGSNGTTGRGEKAKQHFKFINKKVSFFSFPPFSARATHSSPACRRL